MRRKKTEEKDSENCSGGIADTYVGLFVWSAAEY